MHANENTFKFFISLFDNLIKKPYFYFDFEITFLIIQNN